MSSKHCNDEDVDAIKSAKRRKLVAAATFSDDEDMEDEEDARLEDSYLTRRTSTKDVAGSNDDKPDFESSDDNDEDEPPPMHESHAPNLTKPRIKSRKKAKYVPSGETHAERDARTIFVGNIPITVAKSKSSQKQLKRHFLSHIPGSKIESVRFRSVAFAAATATLPPEDAKTSSSKGVPPSTKQQRQQDRAAQWRESSNTNLKPPQKGTRGESETSDREDQYSKAKKMSYLSPAEKKRVAFIKGDFHEQVDTVNGYIVFAHTEQERKNNQSDVKTATVTELHPVEMARLAVERCDGSTFLERTIRVDRVGRWRMGVTAARSADVGGTSPDVGGFVEGGDSRATLFVGNLDFAAREEELRVWFEGVVSQERGPPGEEGETESEHEDGGGSGVNKHKAWVRSVRIIRDSDTQLGKGFAYVRFLDRECVDEILGLESSNLKFAKRTLRVQRCKVVPGTTSSGRAKHHPPSVNAPQAVRAKTTVAPSRVREPLPKGDPTLGAKLAGLSKDERKAVKAANVDRVKRRLAKKKVKAGMDKVRDGKVRERDRQYGKSKGKGKGKGAAKTVNKGRMRSDKSVEKRNAKK